MVFEIRFFLRISEIIKLIHLIGAIQWIEHAVGHAVHWSICLLHLNELPFRELFIQIDGVSVGPRQFSGNIGKMLPGCETRPIKKKLHARYIRQFAKN